MKNDIRRNNSPGSDTCIINNKKKNLELCKEIILINLKSQDEIWTNLLIYSRRGIWMDNKSLKRFSASFLVTDK